MTLEEAAAHRGRVRQFAQTGGPLDSRGPNATTQQPQWFTPDGTVKGARDQLHTRLIADYRAQFPSIATDRQAVILAGPPGAGKSTVRREHVAGDDAPWLRIDADEFKRLLLQEALGDGTYERLIVPAEVAGAGERFYPMELASLVHEESSLLAARLRDEAIAAGENVIVDSVMSNPEGALRLGRQLERAGYSIEVVAVEVPYEVSQASIEHRWQLDYAAAVEAGVSDEEELGGRWVPSDYARSIFRPGQSSWPAVSAEQLSSQVGAVTRFRQFHGERPDGPRELIAEYRRTAPGAALTQVRDPQARQRMDDAQAKLARIQPRPEQHRGPSARGPQRG